MMMTLPRVGSDVTAPHIIIDPGRTLWEMIRLHERRCLEGEMMKGLDESDEVI